MKDLRSEFKQATKWRFISQLIYLPASFFTSVILVRYLSPVDYGNYRIVLSLSGIMIYIVSLGVQHSISRFAPEFIELKNHILVNRLVGRLSIIRFIAVTAVVIFLNVFKSQFVEFFNLPDVFLDWLWLISIIYVLTHTAIVFGQYFHTAILDMKTIIIHDSIKPVLFVLLLVLVATLNMGFSGVLILLLLCELFSFVFYFASYRIHIKRYMVAYGVSFSQESKVDWQRVVKYSIHSALYTFGGLAVGTYVDSFVIAKFLDVSRVAFYTFGLMLVMIVHSFNPVTLFKNIMTNVLVRRYVSSADRGIFQSFFVLTSKLGLFISLPLFLVLCILLEKIIPIVYRQDYLYAVPAIYVFSIMLLSRNFSYGLSAVITTLELVRYFNFYYVIALYNLVASIILVQLWGILGVAIATSSAEVIWCFCLTYFVVKKAGIKIRIPGRQLLVIVGNAMIVSFLVLQVRHLVNSVLALLIAIVIAGFLYLVLSTVTKPFTNEERSKINAMIGRQLWQF